MSGLAVRVEHLAKRYRLGERDPYGSLRDTLARVASTPFRRNRRAADDRDADTFWALDDISFDIPSGEAVGIIGRNGAGKTTLLKILSRITKPTRGQAALYGRVSSLLEVGTGFHPELTGRENIYLNGAILGMRRDEINRKFDEIVDFADNEKFLDTPMKRYSSGMYVRLAFSVAAHLEPEILLVDEVLAVGDTVFQQKCLGKMGEVARSGRTILFVSHNLLAIQQLCARGILIDRGKLIADGGIRSVVERYLSTVGDNLSEAVDLADKSFPHWQRTLRGELRLQKCALFDAQGQPSARFRFNEPFTVYLEAISPRQFEIIDAGFFIYTNTDVLVCSIWNKEANYPLSIEPDKPLKIHIRVDRLGLLPGSYYLSPYVESGQYAGDFIRRLLQIEVTEMGHDESQPIPEYGLVAAESTWWLDDDGQ